MMIDSGLLAPALLWVGRPHVNCYSAVREVYQLAGIELPEDRVEAQALFVRVWEAGRDGLVFRPRAFDVLRIANAYAGDQPLVNHVAVAIGDGFLFLHTMEDCGFVISDALRAPWRFRVRSAERYVG